MARNTFISGQWLTTKECSRCGQVKTIEDFSKDKHHTSGHKSACKLCASSDFKLWKERDPENAKKCYRKASYKKSYELSDEEAQSLVNNRINICSICGETKPLVVDHCHTTLKIRGMICASCNSMLGYSRDNIDTLQQAIIYLKDFYE